MIVCQWHLDIPYGEQAAALAALYRALEAKAG